MWLSKERLPGALSLVIEAHTPGDQQPSSSARPSSTPPTLALGKDGAAHHAQPPDREQRDRRQQGIRCSEAYTDAQSGQMRERSLMAVLPHDGTLFPTIPGEVSSPGGHRG